jgi:hypothetical protein
MIRPTIRYFHSPDVEDLESFRPESDFALLVSMMIGPDGGEGEESFDVLISTPGCLEEWFAADGLVSGEHRLIVFGYDWRRIEDYLRKRVSACTGCDWREVAGKIGRFAQWEFEDYEP